MHYNTLLLDIFDHPLVDALDSWYVPEMQWDVKRRLEATIAVHALISTCCANTT